MDGGEAMSPFSKERAREHDAHLEWALDVMTKAGLPIVQWHDRDHTQPDLGLETPTGLMPVEFKLARPFRDGLSVVSSVSQWERFSELPRMHYAIIYPGSVAQADIALVSRGQLAERQSQIFRGSNYLDNNWMIGFDVPPHYSRYVSPAFQRHEHLLDLDPHRDLQLGLDGTVTPHPITRRTLGETQREILKYVSYWPGTSTEIGTFIHEQYEHGSCGHFARDHKYASPYSGLGCCAEASSRGSAVAKSLEGALWRDDNRRWRVRDEAW
jgi:hypothetical protein